MHVLDLVLPELADNLALDEALLMEAEAGRSGEVLRLWEWRRPAVVLGAGCHLAEDVDELACRADGVPITRRASGGGTVLLGPGCLIFSLVLAYKRAPTLCEIQSSYHHILTCLCSALEGVLPGAEHAGTSDLAATGLKFSGNAQQRKRNYLLHHGTLLYDFDIQLVQRYLRLPARQPGYRGGREHATFLRNLPISAAELRRRLRDAWGADTDRVEWPVDLVRHLIAAKYRRDEWVRRK